MLFCFFGKLLGLSPLAFGGKKNVVKFLGVGAEHTARVGQNTFGQSEFLRDIKRVRCARNADCQIVSRAEGFRIEIHRSVFDAVGGEGKFLKLVVVAGDNGLRARFLDIFRDGNRKHCAFRRICACAEFVQKQKTFCSHFSDDFGYVFHVPRKSGQVLFDALFVAYIRINFVKHWDFGIFGRQKQARHRH